MKKSGYRKDDFIVGKSLPPASSADADHDDEPQVKKRPFWKRLMAGILLLAVVFTLIIASWNAINISRAAEKMFGSGNLLELVSSGGLDTGSNGRVNILTVGYSVDDPGHLGADLTDSIMILSIDPADKTGYMLSIPRDLYLKIPDNGYGKINEVYKDGGMDLLEEIVQERLGININYWLVVNYAAVRQIVDSVGGITVGIKSSDPRGLYDPNISPAEGGPFQLSNGTHHLNGQTALNLTRARGATYGSYGFPRSDLTRIEHQKQVFLAIKDKISDWKLVLNPMKNSRIFNAAAQNLKTDIEAREALPLYRLFASIPTAKLRPFSLHSISGNNLLVDGPGGLVPAAGLNNYGDIQDAIDQISR